jgi:hypothetical protein
MVVGLEADDDGNDVECSFVAPTDEPSDSGDEDGEDPAGI